MVARHRELGCSLEMATLLVVKAGLVDMMLVVIRKLIQQNKVDWKARCAAVELNFCRAVQVKTERYVAENAEKQSVNSKD